MKILGILLLLALTLFWEKCMYDMLYSAMSQDSVNALMKVFYVLVGIMFALSLYSLSLAFLLLSELYIVYFESLYRLSKKHDMRLWRSWLL